MAGIIQLFHRQRASYIQVGVSIVERELLLAFENVPRLFAGRLASLNKIDGYELEVGRQITVAVNSVTLRVVNVVLIAREVFTILTQLGAGFAFIDQGESSPSGATVEGQLVAASRKQLFEIHIFALGIGKGVSVVAGGRTAPYSGLCHVLSKSVVVGFVHLRCQVEVVVASVHILVITQLVIMTIGRFNHLVVFYLSNFG